MKFILERDAKIGPHYYVKDLDENVYYSYYMNYMPGFHSVRFMDAEGTILGHAELTGFISRYIEMYVDEEMEARIPYSKSV